jgi:hypothetical protein
MVADEVADVMHWTCPACDLQWLGTGRGFSGQRFSRCVRCGGEACEPDDATRASHRPDMHSGGASATGCEVRPS